MCCVALHRPAPFTPCRTIEARRAMTRQHLGYVALLVRDYDEALSYYTGKLGFEIVEDSDLGHGKRWVLIAPPGSTETRLLLARAVSDRQAAQIGNQSGGRVFLFLHTDDFHRDYQA